MLDSSNHPDDLQLPPGTPGPCFTVVFIAVILIILAFFIRCTS